MSDRTPPTLNAKTLFITGASRGIGKAIALRAARNGARIVVAAKTAEPDPRLPGTIHSAAAEIEAAGGQALALVVDVRDAAQVQAAVEQAVQRFGGIDVLVNNASAIHPHGILETPAKRYDLMMDINVRGTFLLTKAALPHLRKSANPHVVTLAPPLNMNPHWLGAHPAYTLSKYGMTLLSLGWAAEYGEAGIGFSCLWPETYIATSAVANLADGSLMSSSRSPEIMGDAAVEILSRPPADVNGKCFIDSAVLAEAGVTDLARYGGGDNPILDIFVDKL